MWVQWLAARGLRGQAATEILRCSREKACFHPSTRRRDGDGRRDGLTVVEPSLLVRDPRIRQGPVGRPRPATPLISALGGVITGVAAAPRRPLRCRYCSTGIAIAAAQNRRDDYYYGGGPGYYGGGPITAVNPIMVDTGMAGPACPISMVIPNAGGNRY